MSEEQTTEQQTEQEVVDTPEATEQKPANEVELQGLYATKQGMSSVYDDNGHMTPVTVLKYEQWFVSQVKTKEKEGYEAVQVACGPKKARNCRAAERKRLSPAGFENGARWTREIRQELPEGVQVGQRVNLSSLTKGDKVSVMSHSKGRGFSGVIKRWGFAGGPAAHGSKFHRQPGSIGNRTWPGRVIAGKKLPGQYGNERMTLPRVEVVDVIADENVILVKGPVPGSKNSLVKLMKV